MLSITLISIYIIYFGELDLHTECPIENVVFLPLVNRNNSEYLNELRVQKQSLGMELLFHQQENAKITTQIQNSDLYF